MIEVGSGIAATIKFKDSVKSADRENPEQSNKNDN